MAAGGRTGAMFSEINVTPLTDVFLVLLVIMILIAPLSKSHVLKISPPGFTPHPSAKVSKIDVDVMRDGHISVNGNPVAATDLVTLTAAIQAQQKKSSDANLSLDIRADGDALQKNVVAVMDAANGCGIKNLRILPPSNSLTLDSEMAR